MKLQKITNFVIVVLVITAIFQTQKLWLEGTSGHNFFYTVFGDIPSKNSQADGNVLLATRYAVGEGEGIFSVYYPDDTGSSSMLETANGVLREILAQNSGGSEKKTADWREILEDRCIVMQYDFMIASEEYLERFKNAKSSERLKQFDYITVIPAKRAGEMSHAYFVNSETNECVEFSASEVNSAPSLYRILVTEPDDTPYISTGQRTGSSVLWRNLFLPQWADLPHTYGALEQEHAFEKDGEPSRTLLENTVENFFRNFSVDWSTRDENGVFTFSDSETVVKYFPRERVLAYYSYENYGDDRESISLTEGYQICCNFLKNDNSLETDIYLADVERTINNELIYYFDYAVDDLPVYLSQNVQDKTGSAHAIEMTVRNRAVKEYRRYAVNYTVSPAQDERVEVQFIDALDEANRMYQSAVEEKVISDVKNISLGYQVEPQGPIRLKWFVNLYDYIFVVDTDRTETETRVTSPEE